VNASDRPPRIAAATRAAALLLTLVTLAGCGERSQQPAFPELSGPYLGQQPPGAEAELFAPGIVSAGISVRDVPMTPDGREIYFGIIFGRYEYYTIMVTRLENGRWTEPRVAPFAGKYNEMEPAISPDGKRFFFFSFRPLSGEGEPKADSDLWVMDREGEGWGEPRNLGAPVNSEQSEYFPSITADGTLYFTREGENRTSRIYRARPDGDGFAEPEPLGSEVNSTGVQYNAFVAPDESYLIYSTPLREDGMGGEDYYISFRDENDEWTGPINLGTQINTAAGQEHSPYVSPDGTKFFFMATRSIFADGAPRGNPTIGELKAIHARPGNGNSGIWWIDAAFIEELRPR